MTEDILDNLSHNNTHMYVKHIQYNLMLTFKRINICVFSAK